MDGLLLLGEVIVIVTLVPLSLVTRIGAGLRSAYADVLTFCQVNNISPVEVLTLLPLPLVFLFLDFFLCAHDEDTTDVFFLVIFFLVGVVFTSLLGCLDALYIYMVSSGAGDDALARAIAQDAVNNLLCVLRIFFC